MQDILHQYQLSKLRRVIQTDQPSELITMAKPTTQAMTTAVHFAGVGQEHRVIFVQCNLQTINHLHVLSQAWETTCNDQQH